MLSELDVIKLGVGYRIGGTDVTAVPSSIAELEAVEVVYEDLPGWKADISKVNPGSVSGRSW